MRLTPSLLRCAINSVNDDTLTCPCVCVQSVWTHSGAEQRSPAQNEPICADQPRRSLRFGHHLHAHRNQVRRRHCILHDVTHAVTNDQKSNKPSGSSPPALYCHFKSNLSLSNYHAMDTASAVAIALMTFGTMYPMSVYSGKVLLQVCDHMFHETRPVRVHTLTVVLSFRPPRLMSSVSWINCSERSVRLLHQIHTHLHSDTFILGVFQVSTLDGVLEVRNEHFWTIGFGSLVCRFSFLMNTEIIMLALYKLGLWLFLPTRLSFQGQK